MSQVEWNALNWGLCLPNFFLQTAQGNLKALVCDFKINVQAIKKK